MARLPLACDFEDDFLGRSRASVEALRSSDVVPSALVDPDRAEHTIASLCWSRYVLQVDMTRSGFWFRKTRFVETHETISLAIFTANLPTLVPPYF